MRAYLEGHEIDDRVVWVADEFRAAPEPDRAPSLPKHGVAGFHADLNLVRDGFERFGILDDRVRFLQGSPPSVLADAPIEQIALLRIGAAAAADLDDVLEASYDHVAAGGYVIVEGDTATREIVERFRTARDVTSPLERVDDGTVAWRRGIDDRTATPGDEPEPARAGGTHVPLAPLAPPETLDLSVVVVFYEMRREAERTLRALSRAYQEGLDDIDYEVIVVENGSSPEQRLGEEYVRGFGSEFRYVDLADAAAPSPVGALNRGIREGRGNAFALMIDGAHVLTPGVLRYGLAGLSTYDPAIVATQQWYVGPGQQGDAMDNGYDQAYEDRLFDLIAWPTAGYRLFEIGHFVGDRDWLDGLWESNCMFVRRAQLEQVGAFDEGFDMAGGGYANLELYERLGAHAGVNVTTILGEGSFHQSHGGTTTNQPDAAERRARVFGYSQHYADRRGRAFKGPGKPIHYVGRFETAEARRSKPRRISAARFAEAAAPGGVDGPPEVSTPVPDELAEGFVEAVWMNRPWDDVRWLGHDFDTAPADAFAYQEMISEATPDWIIETGGGGGRSLFLATMCELVGHGEVIAVSEPGGDDRPEHERLHHVDGAGGDEAVAATIRRMVGSERALVVLGSRSHRRELVKEFEAYAPLVPVGSWVVVTDTIVNGNPVWAGFGPGPAEAVKSLLQHHGEFARDPDKEKYSFTFNPGGYLRRVS